jgi:hypothetical protein
MQVTSSRLFVAIQNLSEGHLTRTRDQNFRRLVSIAPPDIVYTLRLLDFGFFPLALATAARRSFSFSLLFVCFLAFRNASVRPRASRSAASCKRSRSRVFALQLLNFLIRKH